MRKFSFKNICIAIFAILLLLAMVIPFFYFSGASKSYTTNSCITLDDHWDVDINDTHYSNVTLSDFTFPMTQKGDIIVLSRKLNEAFSGRNPIIKFNSVHVKVDAYLNGHPVYTYGGNEFFHGKLVGYGTQYISLPSSYNSKPFKLILSVTEDDAFNGIEPPELGNGETLLQESISDNRFLLATALFLIVFGLIVAAVTAVLSFRNLVFSRLFCISLFSFLIGCWTLCNNNLIIFFASDLRVKAYLEYISLYAMPLPLLCYFYPEAHHKVRPKYITVIYQCLIVAQTAFFLFALITQLTNVIHLPVHLKVAQLLMFLELIFILALTIDDIRNHRKYDRALQVGVIATLLVVMVELIRYNVEKYIIHFHDSHYSSSVCYSALIIIVALLLDYSSKISHGLYKQAQQQLLENMAFSDELTGLHNRRKCDEIIEKLTAQCDDFILVSMDLNLLKYYNDTYGHEKGDELLRCFAGVLKEAFPNALSCARMGGDEFTVILPAMHETKRNAALLHLYKLMDEQNKKDPSLKLSTALGYVTRSEFGREVDIRMLYQEADERMYQNKKEMKEKQPELFRR